MSTSEPSIRLRLGPEVVQKLLPQRRPLLLVDTIDSYERGPTCALRASRHISINEPIFEGHFPNYPLWPGAFIIEGLGQSCHLLAVISGIEQALTTAGRQPDEALQALRELQRALRGQPGARATPSDLLQLLGTSLPPMGMLAAVNVRFSERVFPGQRLDYFVRQAATQPSATLLRFEVEAQSDNQIAARGDLIVTRGLPLAGSAPA